MDIVIHRELGLVNITLTQEELSLAVIALSMMYGASSETTTEERQAEIREMFKRLAETHKAMEQ